MRREVPGADSGHHGGARKRTTIDDGTRIRVCQVYDACDQHGHAVHRRRRSSAPVRVHVMQRITGPSSSRVPPRLNGRVERSHRADDLAFSQLLGQNGVSDDIHLFNQKL